MSFFDELKKITQPYDDQDDFVDPGLEEPVPEAAPPAPRARRAPSARQDAFAGTGEPEAEIAPTRAARRESRPADKVVNLNSASQMKVVLVKPERFELAAEIADHLRDRRAVLMNLEETEKNTARRLIDFLSGVAYAQEGKIRRVATATYIITPYNVDLMGDQLDEMESGAFQL